MKKRVFLSVCVVLCLSLLFSACTESPPDDSSDPSSESSRDSNNSATGVTDDNSVQAESSVIADETSIFVEETSEPIEESSGPDVSTEESAPSNIHSNSVGAWAYRIAYTKVNPTAAKECVTNPAIKITAIYDGVMTRFFHSVTGEYYHALPGKYLYYCCDSFSSGDVSDYNLNYSYQFSFDENGAVTVTEKSGHDHETAVNSSYLYSAEAGIFILNSDGNAKAYEAGSGIFVICRKLEHSTESSSFYGIAEEDLGKYGVVCNNEIIIPFEYDGIDSFQSESDLGVYRAVKDGKTYYISSSGENLNPDGFTCGAVPLQNRAWVFDGEQGYVIEFIK